jgi:hypothetical protein
MATSTAATATAERQQRPRFSLTERELREYSLARAILTSARCKEGAEDNCFELEVSEQLEREHTNVGPLHGGIRGKLWLLDQRDSPRDTAQHLWRARTVV